MTCGGRCGSGPAYRRRCPAPVSPCATTRPARPSSRWNATPAGAHSPASSAPPPTRVEPAVRRVEPRADRTSQQGLRWPAFGSGRRGGLLVLTYDVDQSALLPPGAAGEVPPACDPRMPSAPPLGVGICLIAVGDLTDSFWLARQPTPAGQHGALPADDYSAVSASTGAGNRSDPGGARAVRPRGTGSQGSHRSRSSTAADPIPPVAWVA